MTTATTGDPVCPNCHRVSLTPELTASWRGEDVCAFCAVELQEDDAETARKIIRQHRLERVTLRLTPREDA